MNKTLIALAVLAGFAGAAAAQSSVTLSGGVDAGLIRKNSDTTMGGTHSSTNNITFSGVEDLGNGNSAFFTLNHRFNLQSGVQNGTNGASGTSADTTAPFFRNAFVGLKNVNIGDVRLGRILFPQQELNSVFEPWGAFSVATVNTDGRVASNATADLRADSAIYGRTANFGGFVGHLAIAAQDGAGNQTNAYAKPLGAAATYTFGPASVAYAFDRNGTNVKTNGLYAKYDLGVAILSAQYERTSDINGDAAATSPSDKRVSIGAKVPYGAFTGKIGYLTMNRSDLTGSAKKAGIGLDYALSKRTTFYTDAAKVGGSAAEVATVAGGVADDAKSRKYRFDLGVRHSF